jgi:Fur family transcriptional regulator, ferric uptake regulator
MEEQPPHRNTRQRQIILEELQGICSHPTAAALYEIVRHRLPRISLGTVYRNLELLSRLGIIRKLEFGAEEARFDGNVTRHDHVRCVNCGRMDDIRTAPLDLPGGLANDWSGYQILGCRIQYVGLCPACQAAGATPVGSGDRAEATRCGGSSTATVAEDEGSQRPHE